MPTREQIFSQLRDKRAYLATEFGVRKIGLFGSFVNGRPTEDSDIDIVVEFERPPGFRFLKLVEFLENLLGRKVDVLTPAGLKTIRVRHIANSIAESIVYV